MNNVTIPTMQVRYVALVRDKDGRPIFDKPLRDYPPEVREAFLAQMTEEERKEFSDDPAN